MRALSLAVAVVIACSASRAADPKPDFKLTADELVTQAKDNEKKFAGKVIEVTGEVARFGKPIGAKMGIVEVDLKTAPLPNSPKDFPISFPVTCVMVDPEPWASVLPGQRVKITGTFDRGLVGATLKDCKITDAGASVIIKDAPKDLLKAATDDRQAAQKKYSQKWMRVTGTVTSTGTDPNFGLTKIVLNVDGAAVECSLQKDLLGAIKVGEKATLVGQVFTFKSDLLTLAPVLPITKK